MQELNFTSTNQHNQLCYSTIAYHHDLSQKPWPIVLPLKNFIMLSSIIPWLKSITGENIDIYFEPLMEELKQLWQNGVHVHDASNKHGEHHFMLQAIQLWIIHDLPTYGAISWLAAKGYQGCPICSTHTISRRSKVLSKNVYTCQHRRWLPQNHEFHKDLATFDGV